jgi:hypothetical protein
MTPSRHSPGPRAQLRPLCGLISDNVKVLGSNRSGALPLLQHTTQRMGVLCANESGGRGKAKRPSPVQALLVLRVLAGRRGLPAADGAPARASAFSAVQRSRRAAHQRRVALCWRDRAALLAHR